MIRAIFVVALVVAKTAHSQVISSCGQSGDILQNAVISTDPSPIDKSKPFSVTIGGTLSEAITAGNINVNLNIKALGIINEPVTADVDFGYTPGFAKGDTKIVVGPFQLPSQAKSTDITGQVKITDSSANEVMCIEFADSSSSFLRGSAPSSSFEAAEEATAWMMLTNDDDTVEVGDGPVASNCGTSADHLQNVQVTNDGVTTTVTGTLDEDISAPQIDVDLKVKASFIKIPVKLNIPVSITPAIPSGDLKMTFTPKSASEKVKSGITVTVNGQIKAEDAKSSEIGCLQLTE